MPTPNNSTTIIGTAMDNAKVSKVDIEMACQALVAGLLANYQPGDVFKLKAGTFTRDEVVAAVMGFIQDCEDTKAKKLAWRAAVQIERATLAKVRPIRTGLHSFFQTLFGKDGAELRTYGFEPQKPRETSVKAKAAGQEQAAETRKARGTKGKKQRDAIQAQSGATPAAPATPKS